MNNDHKNEPHVFLGHRSSRDGVLSLDKETRRRHVYSIGSTDAGKTTFLQSLIKQDIHAGRGVCLIDPHGDLAEEIIEHIPRHRINDVIYFDASDREHPIGFNLLAGWEQEHERELVASQLVSTFKFRDAFDGELRGFGGTVGGNGSNRRSHVRLHSREYSAHLHPALAFCGDKWYKLCMDIKRDAFGREFLPPRKRSPARSGYIQEPRFI